MNEEHKCIVCGKPFMAVSKTHEICSNECRYEHLCINRANEKRKVYLGYKIKQLQIQLAALGSPGECHFCRIAGINGRMSTIFNIKGNSIRLCFSHKNELKKKYASNTENMEKDVTRNKPSAKDGNPPV